jgi:tRNA A58 N-methylase Trm61
MAYELRSARYLAAQILQEAVEEGDCVVDATMGNGHDTLMLCRLVGETGRVIAFDIQEEAVARTAQLLEENGLAGRARLLCRGHEHLLEEVPGEIAAMVMNLGWLPGGNHQVTTLWETTRQAVEAGLKCLRPGGVLVVCAYPGHEEGNREREQLTTLLSGLSNRTYNVLQQRFLNASPNAPVCYVVQKNAPAGRQP